jgi:hypothetical protein
MNFREGTRRLGIVFGVLGGTISAFAGYPSARDLWNVGAANRKFESLMASPTMMKVAKAAKEYDPWEKYKSKFRKRLRITRNRTCRQGVGPDTRPAHRRGDRR